MRQSKWIISSLILIVMTASLSGNTIEKIDLKYDNIWGSLYNPVREQCDETPTITADGSRIDTLHASQHRWVAVSQDLLWSPRRHRLFVKDSLDNRYRGRLHFGDTIWIESPNPNINGKWVVHDLMNKKWKNAIDFLQTTGDGSLYDNNKLWDGKFKIISVYTISKGVKIEVTKATTPNLMNFVEKPKNKLVTINKYLSNLDDIRNCLYKNCVDAEETAWRLRVNMYKRKTEKDISNREIDSIKKEIHRYDNLERMYNRKIKKLNKIIIIN